MHFMANSRAAEGVTAQELTEYFDANGVSSEVWDLVQHGIVSEYAFKVGEHPGLVLFLRTGSEDDARRLVDSFPIVKDGLLRFELEPLGVIMHLTPESGESGGTTAQ